MLTFSEKATKIDKIFTVNLTVCSNCQIDGEDFVNFCGLLEKILIRFSKPRTTKLDGLHSERTCQI